MPPLDLSAAKNGRVTMMPPILPPVLPEGLAYLFALGNQIQSITLKVRATRLTVLDWRNNKLKELPTADVSDAGKRILLSIGSAVNPITDEIVNEYSGDDFNVAYFFDNEAIDAVLAQSSIRKHHFKIFNPRGGLL